MLAFFKRYIYDLMRDKRNDLLSRAIKTLLLLTSYLYGLLVRCNNFFYRISILKSHKAPVTVISVGNITLGGTGKTPFVIMLSKRVKKPAVLIRGYGEDEWKMLEDKLGKLGGKVFVGKDRVKTAKEAIRDGADVIILDDGFQHRRLKRDLNIALIDSANPFGNRRLFPRGILREPISGLKRADIIVLTKSDMAKGYIPEIEDEIKKLAPGKPIIRAFHRPTKLFELWGGGEEGISFLHNKRICVFSAICDSLYFKHTAETIGARVLLEFVFPDHYNYKRHDLERIFAKCKTEKIDTVVTTEKDAVKLKNLRFAEEGIRVMALAIELEVTEGDKELDASLYRLHMRPHSQVA